MLPDNDYNKWLKYRGHAQRWRDMESHPNGTLGYSPSGIFQDVILVPPFSNITVRIFRVIFADLLPSIKLCSFMLL